MEMSGIFGFRLIYGRRMGDKNDGDYCVFEVLEFEGRFDGVKVSYVDENFGIKIVQLQFSKKGLSSCCSKSFNHKNFLPPFS